jgi:hypothetical protein
MSGSAGRSRKTHTREERMSGEQVFISYSHEDRKWRDDFDKHLKPYLRDGSIVSWSDREIAPGSDWFGAIQSALTNCKIAVLLVSSDFLASDFIHEHELGPLLKKAEQGGLKILWVPVSASSYEKTLLKNYQALHDLKEPLDGMTAADREKAWVKICRQIEKAVKASKDPFPSAPPIDPKPGRPHPHWTLREVLFLISRILVVVVPSVILVSVVRKIDNGKVSPPKGGIEVKIGDEVFLRSEQGTYVITAMQLSQINWPRLGNKDKVRLTLLGDGPLRNGSVVRIQSLEQNLQGNDVLGVVGDSLSCYYSKHESGDEKQDWIVHKRNGSDPVLHYEDGIYLENAYYRSKLLTKNPQNVEFLTLDEGVEWWWALEKVF